METKLTTICSPVTKSAKIFKMAFKMAAENRKFNISDCMLDKTDIPSAKRTLLWSRNAMETKLITICFPITKFAVIIQDGVQDGCRKRKLNISDCMADKTEIPSVKHSFLWSRNANGNKANYNILPIAKFAPKVLVCTN